MLKKNQTAFVEINQRDKILFMILFLITDYNNSKIENVVCNTCNYMHIIDHFTLRYYLIKPILLKNKNQICKIRICHNKT